MSCSSDTQHQRIWKKQGWLQQEEETDTMTHLGAHLDGTPIHVEKMVKMFKSRWCALGFDTIFYKAVTIQLECHLMIAINKYY